VNGKREGEELNTVTKNNNEAIVERRDGEAVVVARKKQERESGRCHDEW
jgi:hypothetical protein